MNEEVHIDSDKLARYLCNESDAAERATVEKWVSMNPANAKELSAFRSIWDSAVDSPVLDVDVDGAWQKLSIRMQEEEGAGDTGNVIPLKEPKISWRWLAAAAMIAGLFVGLQLLMKDRPVELLAANEHQRSTLADNSTLTLSPYSTSTVEIAEERRITLSGEAFFEVARDEERPFIVSTKEVVVTVLGTAFEVSAYDTSNTVLVRVKHGRVRVEVANEVVELGAGEQVHFNKTTKQITRSRTRTIERWGDRIIQFQAAPMDEVVDQLQLLYDVKIKLANSLQGRCKLTATFEDEPIHDILLVIAETYGFKLTETSSGSFILNGDGC